MLCELNYICLARSVLKRLALFVLRGDARVPLRHVEGLRKSQGQYLINFRGSICRPSRIVGLTPNSHGVVPGGETSGWICVVVEYPVTSRGTSFVHMLLW